MSEVTVNSRLFGLKDVNLHVEDHGGDGRPVVLIHGWPLSGASWSAQVEALRAAGFRVITYDRRGFGRSDKPKTGFTYDTLSDDLAGLLEALDLRDVSLVGFSMGGGEVARLVARHGEDRLHSVVFAAAVPPLMMKGPGNEEGPLEPAEATKMSARLATSRETFFDDFVTRFFSANGDGPLLVTESERQDALRMTEQADKFAALESMQAFGFTDFRDDLTKVTVPTLVIHGDSDGVVPFEGSGRRTHELVGHSELVVVPGAPHGLNVSHADEFNRELIRFLSAQGR